MLTACTVSRPTPKHVYRWAHVQYTIHTLDQLPKRTYVGATCTVSHPKRMHEWSTSTAHATHSRTSPETHVQCTIHTVEIVPKHVCVWTTYTVKIHTVQLPPKHMYVWITCTVQYIHKQCEKRAYAQTTCIVNYIIKQCGQRTYGSHVQYTPHTNFLETFLFSTMYILSH